MFFLRRYCASGRGATVSRSSRLASTTTKLRTSKNSKVNTTSKKSSSKKPTPPFPITPPKIWKPSDAPRQITEKEFSDYVQPLFLQQWRISPDLHVLSLEKDEIKRQPRVVPFLCRTFPFASVKTVSRFLLDVRQAVEHEKHYPILSFNSRRWNVVVKTHTPNAVGPNASAVGPGLTDRDMRLAVILQRLFVEHYVSQRRVPEPVPGPGELFPTLAALTTKFSEKCAAVKQESSPVAAAAPSPALPLALPLPDDALCKDRDFRKYLFPLYARGWSAALHIVQAQKTGLYSEVAALSRVFGFTTFKAATTFVAELMELATQDKAEYDFVLDSNTVRLRMLNREKGDGRASQLSLRNLRYAVRAEELFAAKFAGRARLVPVDANQLQPQTVAELVALRQPLSLAHLEHNARVVSEAKDVVAI
ncbi:hypothetical protein C8J57DRAFT_1499571 [Mycena rebaudengoi]|nr:hypothetical protein C8J57DRAFT_1499571 [Mycena rebaudengoi]